MNLFTSTSTCLHVYVNLLTSTSTCSHVYVNLFTRLRHIYNHLYVDLLSRLRHIVTAFTSTCSPVYVILFVRLRHADITQLEPREVLHRGDEAITQFVTHHKNNMPDVSDRPHIRPEKIQFWKMQDEVSETSSRKRRRAKTRYPRPHSRLPGMRGKSTNESIDWTIARNVWCVYFKDYDGKTTINLVDECIIHVWLKYISQMVRLRHVVGTSTSCY